MLLLLIAEVVVDYYHYYYENPNEIWKLYGKRKGRYIDGVFEDIIET